MKERGEGGLACYSSSINREQGKIYSEIIKSTGCLAETN